jgi:hypothetical protein
MGPDTESLEERENVAALTQAQVAATVAAFLGKDFHHAFPEVAAPLPAVISRWP